MIRPAQKSDTRTIAELIRALAEYERLTHEVVLDEDRLLDHLFGPRPYAEVLLAEQSTEVVGFALFFHNYSTFLGKPGIYLEDLFVKPEHRGKGHGKALLAALARLAIERGCGRLEWSVLDWNQPSIDFYRSLGARPMNGWNIFRLTGEPLIALAR
jgi:GNAT superfamily N-acetyltransferase